MTHAAFKENKSDEKIKEIEENRKIFSNQWRSVFGKELVDNYNMYIDPPFQFIDPVFGKKVSTISLENVDTDNLPEIIEHILDSFKDYNKKEPFTVHLNTITYDAVSKRLKILCDWEGKPIKEYFEARIIKNK